MQVPPTSSHWASSPPHCASFRHATHLPSARQNGEASGQLIPERQATTGLVPPVGMLERPAAPPWPAMLGAPPPGVTAEPAEPANELAPPPPDASVAEPAADAPALPAPDPCGFRASSSTPLHAASTTAQAAITGASFTVPRCPRCCALRPRHSRSGSAPSKGWRSAQPLRCVPVEPALGSARPMLRASRPSRGAP